jgi:hypothetical protein
VLAAGLAVVLAAEPADGSSGASVEAVRIRSKNKREILVFMLWNFGSQKLR